VLKPALPVAVERSVETGDANLIRQALDTLFSTGTAPGMLESDGSLSVYGAVNMGLSPQNVWSIHVRVRNGEVDECTLTPPLGAPIRAARPDPIIVRVLNEPGIPPGLTTHLNTDDAFRVHMAIRALFSHGAQGAFDGEVTVVRGSVNLTVGTPRSASSPEHWNTLVRIRNNQIASMTLNEQSGRTIEVPARLAPSADQPSTTSQSATFGANVGRPAIQKKIRFASEHRQHQYQTGDQQRFSKSHGPYQTVEFVREEAPTVQTPSKYWARSKRKAHIDKSLPVSLPRSQRAPSKFEGSPGAAPSKAPKRGALAESARQNVIQRALKEVDELSQQGINEDQMPAWLLATARPGNRIPKMNKETTLKMTKLAKDWGYEISETATRDQKNIALRFVLFLREHKTSIPDQLQSGTLHEAAIAAFAAGEDRNIPGAIEETFGISLPTSVTGQPRRPKPRKS
jgi:hypothetical protein